LNQSQQAFRFFVGDDELDLYRECAGQFKEELLVKHVMAPETRHSAESRAAADAELVSLLEQPFPYEPVVMAMTLVHVESQE
jgi:hypothetical protein